MLQRILQLNDVKDDIEFGFANTIPLHHFGMLY